MKSLKSLYYLAMGMNKNILPKNEQQLKHSLQDDFFVIPVNTKTNSQVATLRVKVENDYSIQVPLGRQLINKKIKCGSIAVIVHVFYPDMLPLMLQYLNNIPYKYDLFISTDNNSKKKCIESILKLNFIGDYEIRIFPNRGRDIAPMIVGFADVFMNYDYFLHLHSKQSSHANCDWFKYLLDILVGSEEIVQSIFTLFNLNNIGMIFPQHHDTIRDYVTWGANYWRTVKILKKSGIQINNKTILEFPSGSMFWGKCAILKKLLDQNLSFNDFPRENGQFDGTIAHAIERAILYFVEDSSYSWLKIAKLESCKNKDVILLTNNLADFNKNSSLVYRHLLSDRQYQ